MNSQITYWQNVIISNKKVEPMDDEQEANYQIAEYLLVRQRKKTAA